MNIEVDQLDSARLLVNRSFLPLLKANGISGAEALWRLGGETVKRALKERGTERVFLKDPVSGEPVEAYLKRYTRRPLKEILKAALSLKFKFFGAFEEWDSLLAFHAAGLPTMQPIAVARCREGDCGLTLGLKGFTRASELYPKLKDDPVRRRDLVVKAAKLAAAMHANGMAHQDFYLVHIFVMPDDTLSMIDLQRMIRSPNLARRWVVKDLAQFLFSVRPYAQPGDIALFVKIYARERGLGLLALRHILDEAVNKAETIAKHDARRVRKARAAKS